jgi:hypothetical protein
VWIVKTDFFRKGDDSLDWDENNQRWLAKDFENNEFMWVPSSSSWLATGN